MEKTAHIACFGFTDPKVSSSARFGGWGRRPAHLQWHLVGNAAPKVQAQIAQLVGVDDPWNLRALTDAVTARLAG